MAVMLRQGLTSSRKQLEEILAYVDTPTRRELSQQTGGGTLLYDAIVEASNKVLKDQKNRKAMVVLSDGDDHGSTATLTEAIEAANAPTLWSIRFFSRRILSSLLFHLGGDGKGFSCGSPRKRELLFSRFRKSRGSIRFTRRCKRTPQPVQPGIYFRQAE